MAEIWEINTLPPKDVPSTDTPRYQRATAEAIESSVKYEPAPVCSDISIHLLVQLT